MASSANDTKITHIVICPSAGIGHLNPFLRLSSLLSSSIPNSKLTLILIRPTLSSAESAEIAAFIAAHPHISTSEFHALPPSSSTAGPTADPFLLQYDAVTRSAHRLATHLIFALSPPPSAVFSDFMLASGITQPLATSYIPNFILITTSARFFSLMLSLPRLDKLTNGDKIDIPGITPISIENIPPLILDPKHVFRTTAEINCGCLKHARGILLNSYDFLEEESVVGLRSGEVLRELPHVFTVGPLRPLRGNDQCHKWLDKQPPTSVMYVCFGSRTTLSKEQIKELGLGLEMSGVRFLWVLKTAVVDKEDVGDVEPLLGQEFFERTKERGIVMREWVNQAEVLSYPSVGGFMSHCGWNSVMEAAHFGVPLLAWAQHGDQRVNAEVVDKAGLGIWEPGWGWGGTRVIKGEEIADRIKELMMNESLRDSARRVREEARKAWDVGGSSSKMFNKIIEVCEGKMASQV